MLMTPWILFDDGRGRFGPLTDLRPPGELRTGALSLLERVRRLADHHDAAIGFVTGDALADVVREEHDGAAVNRWPEPAPSARLINARCAEPAAVRAAAALKPGEALVQPDGQLVAACVEARAGQAMLASRRWDPPAHASVTATDAGVLLERPWDIIAGVERRIVADIAWFGGDEAGAPPPGVSVCGDHPVRLGRDVRFHPMVVINADKGPVWIGDGAIVGSFAVLGGPCSIGPGAIVCPHAHIRAGTSVGPRSVVAGEVSASVIEGMTNKSHSGYLGQAYLGRWVNLGAQTTASNLKNTFGPVRMQLEADDPPEDSAQTKLGPVMGDHVRTAIGTRVMTGSCFATGSMVAVSGLPPKFVSRFTFLTDGGARPYDIERFLAAARYAMSRRHQAVGPALEARLRQLARDAQR
jgi:UDP-N-acetylglucosamine diphosphorylase/glucosamine-1-phosphate N-acetyltransferase